MKEETLTVGLVGVRVDQTEMLRGNHEDGKGCVMMQTQHELLKGEGQGRERKTRGIRDPNGS